ncbi:MAG: ABC transporter permease [Polyangiaceae bacterium]
MIRLVWLDYRAMLRERKVLVIVALFAYAILAVPALLSKPPAHVLTAVTGWFGTADPFALFLYVWTDLAMNKLAAIVAVVLAGGLMARERDMGILPILLSKPISRGRYFLVKLLSAWGVLVTVYVAAHVLEAVAFGRSIPGFRAGVFFASMSLHALTLLFSAAFAATLAVVIRRRTIAMVVSLLILMSLMGASFVGFYQPAWRAAAMANPFSLGVQALAHLPSPGLADVLWPMAGLAAMTCGMALLGALAARRVEA